MAQQFMGSFFMFFRSTQLTNFELIEKMEHRERKKGISKQQFWAAKTVVIALGASFVYLYYSRYFFDLQVLALLGLALVAFLPQKSMMTFFKDWWYFVAGVYIYAVVRGFIDDWTPWLYSDIAIRIEKGIFGVVPSEWLQQYIFDPAYIHFYDIVLFYFYLSFFIFPFLTAYILWLRNRYYYRVFVFGFLLLSFLGLLSYFFLPLVPPWLAGSQGKLLVSRTLEAVMGSIGFSRVDLRVMVDTFSPNMVAAFPSLHSAWSFYSALVLYFFYKKRALPFFLIPIGIWIAVVYFGEHYVIDVAAGIVFALISYWITIRVYARKKFGHCADL